MKKTLLAAALLALSSTAHADALTVEWELILHEQVGPHPGAAFSGTFSSGLGRFAEEGYEVIGRPPNVWTAAPFAYDFFLEDIHYGYSHLMEFMILQPTFDHDLLFDSLMPKYDTPNNPDLWFGLRRLPDGSADPTPYFQLADGSISGLYEIHRRISEPSVVGLLALMLGGLLIVRVKR